VVARWPTSWTGVGLLEITTGGLIVTSAQFGRRPR
jgi:hypothetical protein